MSQINCKIAGDLIPLYVDDVLCEDSIAMLEEHLSSCQDCTAKVEALRRDTVLTTDRSAEPLQKIKRQIRKDKRLIAAVALTVMAGLCVWTAFFLGLIEWDMSYGSVKNRMTVVSVSNPADDARHNGGEDTLIVYSGKPDFHVNACCEVTGEKDGVKQVEVTLYMARRWWDIADYLDTVRHTAGGIDWNHIGQPYSLPQQIDRSMAQVRDMNGLQVIYDLRSPVSDTDERQYDHSRQGYVTVYHESESWEKAEGGEIVAVYYGRFKVNRASEISYSGSRQLLWAKEGYDGAA